MLLLACACACGGEDGGAHDGGVPEGCEDMLVARSGGAQRVSDTRCDAIREQPERKMRSTLCVTAQRK